MVTNETHLFELLFSMWKYLKILVTIVTSLPFAESQVKK